MVAGVVYPEHRVRIGTGGVGAGGKGDTLLLKVLRGLRLAFPVSQDGTQVGGRLLGPVDKGCLQWDMNAVAAADLKALFRRKAGVDNAVAVILTGAVLQVLI